MSDLLSITEAAKLLRLKPITLRKWDKEGKLKAIRIGSRGDRRYRKEEILKILGQDFSENKYDVQEMQGFLHPFVSYVDGFIGGLRQIFGRGMNKHIIVIHDGYVKIAYPYQDLFDLGEFLVKKFEDDPDFMDKVTSEFKSIFQKTERLIANFGKKSLIEEYVETDAVYKACFPWNMVVEPLDAYLLKTIKDKLDVDPNEFTRVLGVLTTPLDESYSLKQKKEILKLAILVKQGKEDIAENTKKIASDYIWINGDYVKSVPFTDQDVTRLIKEELVHSEDELKAELEKAENYLPNLEKEKTELIKRLKPGSELKHLLDVTEKIGPMHDWRKEWFLKSQYLFEKIFEKISSEYKINIDTLRSCTPEEILKLLSGRKIDVATIEKRGKYCVMVSTIEGNEILYGKEAQDLEEKELNFGKNETINLLKGTAASTGVVIGTARVVYTAEEADQKVKKGEILVTSMTRPDFVPVMKRAAAIVTNEGGLTCHAAIVSREMNLPCVVGTRIATKIVNDGDILEVNGNHGIIYIIKKVKNN